MTFTDEQISNVIGVIADCAYGQEVATDLYESVSYLVKDLNRMFKNHEAVPAVTIAKSLASLEVEIAKFKHKFKLDERMITAIKMGDVSRQYNEYVVGAPE